ncbi:TRAP transporter large permease [Magnetospira sp. QH-2]|uniref:TRAP transporter large permease n=1 Tax=Magnetospira sp. (strain QH-2) TaxID=1288970 RepID=UPI0003E8146E|nr:TRAP transporter large permease [Magnetospira sp. QH-2]CCQ74942.1 TRAP dicarboxylate transporter, DctM subunit [Magnetospira sp. QH-2]
MSDLAFGGTMIGVLLALIALRLPIGVAMLLCGGLGYATLNGWMPLLNYLKTAPYWRFSTYDLSVVPLFLLMSQFATRAGLSRDLFEAARIWAGGLRGGSAMAAIGACAGFGSVCGSSLATAATMGQVALPELRRQRYDGGLATATLAAGGTLGILIPPSVALVLYAILVEANVATLFQAALIPGVLAALGYVLVIALLARLRPELGPAGDPTSWVEKLRALRRVSAVGVIFIIVIGGIYAGIFTPTEGAAVGACATGLLALMHGELGWTAFKDSLLGMAETTAMIFLILLGADLFNAFLALTQLPFVAAEVIGGSGWSPFMVLAAILLIYLVLGCVMDSLSMILLTVPVFWPIMAGLDFGMSPDETKVWFGILALMVVEVGLITPPVGMNVYVINALARDIPMGATFRGVWPFLLSDLGRVILLAALPGITLWLPGLWGS